jgi:hypothetical protein
MRSRATLEAVEGCLSVEISAPTPDSKARIMEIAV